MKKIIAYLLAFTSLLALAGCGKTAVAFGVRYSAENRFIGFES